MKTLKLIRDGMSLPFKVQAWGAHGPALAGFFRPMSPTEVEEFRQAVAANPKSRVKATAEGLRPHVLTWDCEDGPPDAANIAALPSAFLDGLELVVTGYANTGADGDDAKKSAPPAA